MQFNKKIDENSADGWRRVLYFLEAHSIIRIHMRFDK